MDLARRSLVAGMALIPALTSAAGRPSVAGKDPRSDATGFAKLQGDRRPHVITPWWYDATIYAIVDGLPPHMLLRAEGCETYVLNAEADGSYRAKGVTVTAFKDPSTGHWLDSFDNPLTRARTVVRPNIITGVTTVYPADGSAPRLDGSQMRPSQIAPTGADKAPPQSWLRWLESGDRIGCTTERQSMGTAQPFMETASMWTDRAPFFDRANPRVDATFTSAFLSPWLAWMDMAGKPGHLLWHSTGRKLRSFAELPRGFAARAEQLAPGKLRTDPFAVGSG